MRPAGLHHADARITEVVDHTHEPVFRWNEVGIEDGDELTFCGVETFLQRSGFESVAVAAMDVGDRITQSRVPLNYGISNLYSFVSGIVEHLDVELVFGIVKAADRIDQPVHNELLVEDRELDGDARQLSEVL